MFVTKYEDSHEGEENSKEHIAARITFKLVELRAAIEAKVC